jgi:hypothetical protein
MEFKRNQGHTNGLAISDPGRRVLSHRALNDLLLEVLKDFFDTQRELFPAAILDKETLQKRVQVYRTLR